MEDVIFSNQSYAFLNLKSATFAMTCLLDITRRTGYSTQAPVSIPFRPFDLTLFCIYLLFCKI